jgi:hypothetical protein
VEHGTEPPEERPESLAESATPERPASPDADTDANANGDADTERALARGGAETSEAESGAGGVDEADPGTDATTGHLTVRLGRHADGFYVEDDGPGVPPEQRDTVFDYEFSTDEDGTGLGLAIVEAIARAHGWSVEMTEGSDGGARVVFSGVSVADDATAAD